MAFQQRLLQATKNPLFHLGLGLLSHRGIGPGATAGLHGYQQWLANDLNYRAAQAQFDENEQRRQRLSFLSSPEGAQQLQRMGVPSFFSQYAPEAAVELAGNIMAENYKPRSTYEATDWGILNKFTGQLSEFGPQADGVFRQHPSLKGYDADNYVPASWVEANMAGDPRLLQRNPPQRTPQGPPSVSDNLAFRKMADSRLATHDKIRIAGKEVYDLLSNQAAGGPEQLAGLIKFARLLDPDSVVREGEVALQREVGGLRAYLESMVGRLRSEGGLLGKGQRRSILDATDRILRIARDERDAIHGELKSMAGEFGIRDTYVPRRQPFPTRPEATWLNQEGEGAAPETSTGYLPQSTPALDAAMGRHMPAPGGSGPPMDSFGRPLGAPGDPMFGR